MKTGSKRQLQITYMLSAFGMLGDCPVSALLKPMLLLLNCHLLLESGGNIMRFVFYFEKFRLFFCIFFFFEN